MGRFPGVEKESLPGGEQVEAGASVLARVGEGRSERLLKGL